MTEFISTKKTLEDKINARQLFLQNRKTTSEISKKLALPNPYNCQKAALKRIKLRIFTNTSYTCQPSKNTFHAIAPSTAHRDKPLKPYLNPSVLPRQH